MILARVGKAAPSNDRGNTDVTEANVAIDPEKCPVWRLFRGCPGARRLRQGPDGEGDALRPRSRS